MADTFHNALLSKGPRCGTVLLCDPRNQAEWLTDGAGCFFFCLLSCQELWAAVALHPLTSCFCCVLVVGWRPAVSFDVGIPSVDSSAALLIVVLYLVAYLKVTWPLLSN